MSDTTDAADAAETVAPDAQANVDDGIEDHFADSATSTEVVDTAEATATTEDTTEPPADPEPEQAADTSETASEKSSSGDEPRMVPLEALHEARQQNSDLKSQVNQLLELFKGQQGPKEEPKPANPLAGLDPVEDPQAFNAGLAQLIQGALSEQRQSLEQVFKGQLDGVYESQVRAQHSDYHAKVAVFDEAAKSNPLLKQQVDAADNPALMRYQIGNNLHAIQQVGTADLAAALAQAREDGMAAGRAELQAEIEKTAPQSQSTSDTAKSLSTMAGMSGAGNAPNGVAVDPEAGLKDHFA